VVFCFWRDAVRKLPDLATPFALSLTTRTDRGCYRQRRHDRERDLDARIVDPASQPQHHPTNADSPNNFAGDYRGESLRGLAARKYAGTHGGYREAIEDECSGIICQSFTLEDDKDAPGKLHSPSDG
jgi:hypothetical protein